MSNSNDVSSGDDNVKIQNTWKQQIEAADETVKTLIYLTGFVAASVSNQTHLKLGMDSPLPFARYIATI